MQGGTYIVVTVCQSLPLEVMFSEDWNTRLYLFSFHTWYGTLNLAGDPVFESQLLISPIFLQGFSILENYNKSFHETRFLLNDLHIISLIRKAISNACLKYTWYKDYSTSGISQKVFVLTT